MNSMLTMNQVILMISKGVAPVIPAMHNLTKQLRRNMNIKNNGTEKRRLIEWQSTTKRSKTKGGEKNKKQSYEFFDLSKTHSLSTQDLVKIFIDSFLRMTIEESFLNRKQ